MRRSIAVLVAASVGIVAAGVLGACDEPRKQVRAPTGCAEVAEHVISIVHGEMTEQQQERMWKQREELRVGAAERCEREQYSAERRSCLLQAQSNAQLEQCELIFRCAQAADHVIGVLERALPPAKRDAFDRKREEARRTMNEACVTNRYRPQRLDCYLKADSELQLLDCERVAGGAVVQEQLPQ